MVKYQRQFKKLTGGSSHTGGSLISDIQNGFQSFGNYAAGAGKSIGKFVGDNPKPFVEAAKKGAEVGLTALGIPGAGEFISLVPTPGGGSLASRYHKTHQFTPYEWAHIQEAAAQTLTGKPSKHWENMGIQGGSVAGPVGAYLDLLACPEPRHAAHILQQDSEHVGKFAGALSDSVAKAARYVGQKVLKAKDMSAKMKEKVESQLPQLLHLGKKAHGAFKAAKQLKDAISGDDKKK